MGASVHYAVGTKLHGWRNSIGRAARAEWGEGAPTIGPVSLSLEFTVKRPQSHYTDLQGTVKARYEESEPTTPPDIDKLARAVLDALTGIVYEDDSQVIDVEARKTFGLFPGLSVEIVSYAK